MKDKNIKGITLVSIVVTIIVLLILAGIAISLTLGDNGIFTKAKISTNKYKDAVEKEQEELDKAYGEIKIADSDDSKITITMKELDTIIQEKIAETICTPDYGNGTQITFTNKEYTVEENGYIQMSFVYTAPINSGGVGDFLYINNNMFFRNSANTTWQNALSPIFPVKQGDVIRYENKAQSVTGTFFSIRY